MLYTILLIYYVILKSEFRDNMFPTLQSDFSFVLFDI